MDELNDATLPELDREIERQNTELNEALDWLREQGDAALMFDGELLEQINELDELVVALKSTKAVEIPAHLARC
jgi:hypothetical protein